MSVADYIKARQNTYDVPEKVERPRKVLQGSDASSDSEDSEDLYENDTPVVEFVDITEKHKRYGGNVITLTNSQNRAKEERGKYGDYALVLRRTTDEDGVVEAPVLEVRSPIIRRALKSVLATYSHLNLLATPIKIPEPYEALFHYRTELRQYAAALDRTEEEVMHMNIMTRFIDLHLGPIEKIWQQTVPKQRITFDLLWILFRAEDDVVVQRDHFREMVRVISCEHKVNEKGRFFEIECWRWGYDGSQFGPALEILVIPEFSAARQITQLPFFPVKQLHRADRESLYAELAMRGRKWRAVVNCAHRQYHGLFSIPKDLGSISSALLTAIGPIWLDPHKTAFRSETCRIMLDHKFHVQSNYGFADRLIGANGFVRQAPRKSDSLLSISSSFSGLGSYRRTSKNKKRMLNDVQCHDDTEDYVMSEEEARLCPARARGFSLSSKLFAFFLVDNIQNVDYKENAFHLLELDPVVKETIRALVQMHSSSTTDFDDFVANKGKGIIMSLEGPPGSGKTLTAESIAELTHKPLYAISTSELGSGPGQAESALTDIFDRAKAWDAILLLDEADLFLSKRTQDDMERNAYVTIFLRLLEYYQGILFLTSNRVEEFDPAFLSRIHLKISFPAPNKTTRGSIWRNFLQNLDECRNWDPSVYERLGSELEVNGREIKNLIKPALAIAKYKKEPLTEDIFRLIYSLNNRR